MDHSELFLGKPWLMEEGRLRTLIGQASLVRRLPPADEVEAARRGRLDVLKRAASDSLALKNLGVIETVGGVGVINISGVIEQRMSWIGYLFGGISTELIEAAVDRHLADPKVHTVLLHIDSPGGTVYGVPEAADALLRARSIKPLVAAVNSMACSAAYWLAAMASSISVTPSGDVGSVGVYTLHVDESRALDKEGVKITFIHAGKYKVEGNRFEPLGDAARSHMQASVDESYGQFVRGVARGRGTSAENVTRSYGEGRVVSATKAKAAGMVDRIEPFPETLGRLMTGSGSGGGRRAETQVERLKREHQRAKDQSALDEERYRQQRPAAASRPGPTPRFDDGWSYR